MKTRECLGLGERAPLQTFRPDPISDIRGAFTASQLLPSIHVGSEGVLNQ